MHICLSYQGRLWVNRNFSSCHCSCSRRSFHWSCGRSSHLCQVQTERYPWNGIYLQGLRRAKRGTPHQGEHSVLGLFQGPNQDQGSFRLKGLALHRRCGFGVAKWRGENNRQSQEHIQALPRGVHRSRKARKHLLPISVCSLDICIWRSIQEFPSGHSSGCC